MAVPPVQTVIRLEEGRSRPEAITQSFVFTTEVSAHFTILAEAFLKPRGRGFFLQGDFGSGKSHFLAALLTWLARSPGTETFSDLHAGLRRFTASGRHVLPVEVSLINYRATRPLEHILIECIESSLRSKGVEAGLTPLASFINDFKKILQDAALAADFAGQMNMTVDQLDDFWEAKPRQAYLEGVRFLKKIGMAAPEALIEERHETLARALEAVKTAGYEGLVLIIDELSEFFRSKPDARGLNEDARTLQLVGELTAGAPLWIIAAVQESIERTGDIVQATLRKIKDRFPVKLALSTVHIKALISQRLVQKKPEAEGALPEIYETLQAQFPSFEWGWNDFQAFYPIHPVTITLLDGLGDLFSEHRGIVDFVHYQLAGDPQRHISGILQRPSHELLGPDAIYEHFYPRMAEFSELHVFPKYVIPHLDEMIGQMLENPQDQVLARRIVRVLVLYRIHPTAAVPMVRELTEQVTCALSEQDPTLNVQFVAEAILDPLVEGSQFLVKHRPDTKDPLDAVYEVISEADPAKTLQARIVRRASEIPADDSRLLALPLSELPESMAWPGLRFWENRLYRRISWRQSTRRALVAFLPSGEIEMLKADIAKALSSGEADFAVVFGFGKPDFRMAHTAVWGITPPADEEDIAVLREYLAAHNMAADLNPSNPAEAPLVQPVKEAVEKLRARAHHAAQNVFYAGAFSDPQMTVDTAIRQVRRFDRLVDIAGELLLELRYPGFREIAPRKISPSPVVYRQLIDEFIFPGSLSLQKTYSRGLADAIEGLAKPLGLVELRSGNYVFAPDPEKHPLIATLFGLINPTGETEISTVIQTLRTGRFGLPEEMAHFLLTALAFGGLITLLKDGRSVALELLRYSGVKTADALAPGGVIGRHDRETLINECGFLAQSSGWDSFGLRQQREAWQEAVKFHRWAANIVPEVEQKLSSFAEFSAFEAFNLETIASRLKGIKALSSEIKVSYPAREGLERFLKTWRDQSLTSEDIEFVKKYRNFLRSQAEQFVFVNHYTRHRAVAKAAVDDDALAQYLEPLKDLLNQPENLVMQADPSRLADAFDSFRRQYADAYIRKHHHHFKRLQKKPLSRHAQRALALLKRLATIEALDRPSGLEGLLGDLEAPKAEVCRRNLSEELMRAPVCNCGFIPHETPAPKPPKDFNAAIQESLEAYLVILKTPQVREAVSTQVYALVDADQDTVKRLRSLQTFLSDDQASAAALMDIMDDITAAQLSKALSSRVVIEKRNMQDLMRRLGGRRLAPDQVMESVQQWISNPRKDTVLAIEGDPSSPAESRSGSSAWWPRLHPALFKGEVAAANIDIETMLEHQYPARKLRSPLARLGDTRLIKFINSEPFHTTAIRMAWRLLAERILSGTSWPAPVRVDAKHVDPDMARMINERLELLQSITRYGQERLPQAIGTRIPISELLVDAWTSRELRALAFEHLFTMEQKGREWLSTLAVVEPIQLSDHPIVMVIDGVSPDVWLETLPALSSEMEGGSYFWYRLEVPSKTAEAMAALFGWTEDALDGFATQGIAYHQVKGDEEHPLVDRLPTILPDQTVVIRVALVDEGAHSRFMRLGEMSGFVARFLTNELPHLKQICLRQKRRLIITTDHGLSLTKSGLSHGKGGVYERGIFRVEWRFT